MARISNGSCRPFVQQLKPFKANNIYAEFADASKQIYVVYSYGNHWPLYINVGGKWYWNTDKYGTTTSKHSGQASPLASKYVYMNVKQMRSLARLSGPALAHLKLTGELRFNFDTITPPNQGAVT